MVVDMVSSAVPVRSAESRAGTDMEGASQPLGGEKADEKGSFEQLVFQAEAGPGRKSNGKEEKGEELPEDGNSLPFLPSAAGEPETPLSAAGAILTPRNTARPTSQPPGGPPPVSVDSSRKGEPADADAEAEAHRIVTDLPGKEAMRFTASSGKTVLKPVSVEAQPAVDSTEGKGRSGDVDPGEQPARLRNGGAGPRVEPAGEAALRQETSSSMTKGVASFVPGGKPPAFRSEDSSEDSPLREEGKTGKISGEISRLPHTLVVPSAQGRKMDGEPMLEEVVAAVAVEGNEKMPDGLVAEGNGLQPGMRPISRNVAAAVPAMNQEMVPSTQAREVELKAALGSEAWEKSVAHRVLEAAGEGGRHLTLRLHPASLGSIEVKVSTEEGGARVQFHAQHAGVREAMEAAMPRLREMFHSSGMNLLEASVSRDGGFATGQHAGGGPDAFGAGRQGGGEGGPRAAGVPDEPETSATGGSPGEREPLRLSPDSRIDYYV